MRAVVQDRLRHARRSSALGRSPPSDHRRRTRCSSQVPGRRTRPGHRAPDDGQAVCGASRHGPAATRGTRCPGATWPARWSDVGSAVTRFAVGDEVYGIAPGSFAEYAVAPEAKLARKPANLSFAQAAVVPISAGTALQALYDVGQVQAGSVGAGPRVRPVASAATPSSWPRRSAPRSPASASTAKLDLVASLGADHVLDYTVDDFADGTRPLRPDPRHRGQPLHRRLRRALQPRGHRRLRRWRERRQHHRHGPAAARRCSLSPFVRQRLALLASKERASDYERLTDLIEAGQVVPSLDRSFPLDEAPARDAAPRRGRRARQGGHHRRGAWRLGSRAWRPVPRSGSRPRSALLREHRSPHAAGAGRRHGPPCWARSASVRRRLWLGPARRRARSRRCGSASRSAPHWRRPWVGPRAR